MSDYRQHLTRQVDQVASACSATPSRPPVRLIDRLVAGVLPERPAGLYRRPPSLPLRNAGEREAAGGVPEHKTQSRRALLDAVEPAEPALPSPPLELASRAAHSGRPAHELHVCRLSPGAARERPGSPLDHTAPAAPEHGRPTARSAGAA